MTRAAWLSEITALIARAAKVDPVHARNHPAYRAITRKIDRLIEHGLTHEFITREEACRL